MTGGILKNNKLNQDYSIPENVSDFRKQVLENTQKNSEMVSEFHSKPHGIPKDTLSLKHEHEATAMQWNEKNLADNEITKQQFQDIHVDEPKTPYQGAADPAGEYYRDDDELDDFSLGAPVQEVPAKQDEEEEEEQEEEQEQEELSAEEKHRRFEEMRKKHYNIKEALKSAPVEDEDDE